VSRFDFLPAFWPQETCMDQFIRQGEVQPPTRD
jgi:hypothetical protein